MTFFTLGNHHDFAIVVLGADTPDSPANSPGLYHVASRSATRSPIYAGPRSDKHNHARLRLGVTRFLRARHLQVKLDLS